jgi:aspartate/tyrosine/aromatic aminotransferase
MFAFAGMNYSMCDHLTQDNAIFSTLDGRISLVGLNEGNVNNVSQAVRVVTDGQSIMTAVALIIATSTPTN